ncbi:endonuclease/exonuclease/phosphatase family protein [Microlunatus soli]|uniref:Metal-dependent hydrolase, endonuclease/exonuclease/phosphatase family n=1 Tax=Microlunatus soli TaxID=630515 RepID=A0A1H1N1Z3_9ACTN|nr:endonuclease/exonuclease/phosphatase family protein [Microlunatus soli]SDR93151.1 Metal-dependent hydrolase, endonuclease/exonuclease/phosphatase family [Microlunatus soli]
MRIASLNTWGMRGDWQRRLPRMRAGFSALAADIVLLQETVLTEQVDQAREILGDGFQIAQQSDRERGRAGVPAGQGISTASRWPLGRIVEVDLHLTERTDDFACGCLITEILAPEPIGRVWVAHHFPDYQLDHERERRLQAAAVGRELERLVTQAPGHVVVGGDLDADPAADSIRFWTGRHVIDDVSVCYRSVWEARHSDRPPAETYSPANPLQTTAVDWPFRTIDHVFVRCGEHGPTMLVDGCMRIFDHGSDIVSDHFGVLVDLRPDRREHGD